MVAAKRPLVIEYDNDWGEYTLRYGKKWVVSFCENEWHKFTGFRLNHGEKAKVTITVRRVKA